MGQQTSGLNCKQDQTDNLHEINASKQFAIKSNKAQYPHSQIHQQPNIYPPEHIMGGKSPKSQHIASFSQKSSTTKSSRQNIYPPIFIPQFESLTRVNQEKFPRSVCVSKKNRKFFVEEKQKSLGQIVQMRYNTSKHFPYSQILSLTETLVYSLAYLSRKKLNHHDFYPTNVYYLDGRFKLINPLELPASAFYLTSNRQRFSFLSPELIIAILQETPEEELGPQIMEKADIFAIGMILLETCTLQPSSECYDEESYNIIDSIIRERIGKVAKIYTPNMAEFINMMLQYEIERRLDPLILARLLHASVQVQKQTAYMKQNNRPQGPPQQQNISLHPNNPPQMINQGPPSPYMRQKFQMQNLNPNTIAVSLPDQVYTRIGPNNQGFLSSSSLQQKLRVIELIKQNPNQEEDSQNENEKRVEPNQEKARVEIHGPRPEQVRERQKMQQNLLQQPIKPQYAMVQSVYTQQPVQGAKQKKQKENDGQKFETKPQTPISQVDTQVDMENKHINNQKMLEQTRNIQANNFPLYKPQQKIRADQYFVTSKPQSSKFQPNSNQNNSYMKYQNYGYGVSTPSDNNSFSNHQFIKQKNFYTNNFIRPIAQMQAYQQKLPYHAKYGVGTENKNQQNQTLEQRVQRVLQMSKNIK